MPRRPINFDGLGLLTAIAEAAFRQFTATMEAKFADAPKDPAARLQATCALPAFAAEHAGLFHVMFQNDRVCRQDPRPARAAAHGYDLGIACSSAERDEVFETGRLVDGPRLCALGFGAQVGAAARTAAGAGLFLLSRPADRRKSTRPPSPRQAL